MITRALPTFSPGSAHLAFPVGNPTLRRTQMSVRLRGREVVVAKAGTKFRLPEMPANHADTYNLGKAEWFKTNTIENVTSDASLAIAASQVDSPLLEILAEHCQELALCDPAKVRSAHRCNLFLIVDPFPKNRQTPRSFEYVQTSDKHAPINFGATSFL